jgi:hypothetical protein
MGLSSQKLAIFRRPLCMSSCPSALRPAPGSCRSPIPPVMQPPPWLSEIPSASPPPLPYTIPWQSLPEADFAHHASPITRPRERTSMIPILTCVNLPRLACELRLPVGRRHLAHSGPIPPVPSGIPMVEGPPSGLLLPRPPRRYSGRGFRLTARHARKRLPMPRAHGADKRVSTEPNPGRGFPRSTRLPESGFLTSYPEGILIRKLTISHG